MHNAMELYVYYRVASDDAGQLKMRVLEMQAKLTGQYGVQAGLKRRPREEAGMHTWMEVYLSVPEEFEPVLEQAVHDADLPALIHGARHVEYFVDSVSCA
jgi:hypothetical protein